MKLLIRNLSRSTSETELQALFATHGVVQSCTIVLDKKTGLSKGFAFVDMPKAGAAKAAMKALNGSRIDGNKIRVKKDDATPATRPAAPSQANWQGPINSAAAN